MVKPSSTNAVEPTGEAPQDVVIPTNPPDEAVIPTSTLYAIGEPTPTPLTNAHCSYDNPTKLEFQSFEEFRAELHVCNEEVEWPVGYEIVVDELATNGGANTTVGAPVGGPRAIITIMNACAWGNYWLDNTQSGDTAQADAALTYMSDTLLYFRLEGPPGPATADPLYKGIISKAQLGDPSGIQEMLTWLDCQDYPMYRVAP